MRRFPCFNVFSHAEKVNDLFDLVNLGLQGRPDRFKVQPFFRAIVLDLGHLRSGHGRAQYFFNRRLRNAPAEQITKSARALDGTIGARSGWSFSLGRGLGRRRLSGLRCGLRRSLWCACRGRCS